MDTLRAQDERVCPIKLVEQAHRKTDLTVDGFSDIPEESTRCSDECTGPLTEPKPNLIRKIGNHLLPGVVSPAADIPSCPKY